MICRNCGAEIGENKFCPKCGAPASQDRPVNALTPTGDSPAKILVFGIIGLALCSAVVGMIFSIIGMVKSSRYIAANGNISKQVSIGRKLAIAGLVLSIICLVCYIIGAVVIAANWDQIVDKIKNGVTHQVTHHESSHSITFNF